ncbi:MAG: hypothetical protein WBE34_19820 [Candidatus Nitrosopolaris sp.]
MNLQIVPNTKTDVTNIQVRKTTRQRLDNIGIRNESFDSIISRLLDEHEKKGIKK